MIDTRNCIEVELDEVTERVLMLAHHTKLRIEMHLSKGEDIPSGLPFALKRLNDVVCILEDDLYPITCGIVEWDEAEATDSAKKPKARRLAGGKK